MAFRMKNKQNFTNLIEDERPWSVFLWTSMSERYFRVINIKKFWYLSPWYIAHKWTDNFWKLSLWCSHQRDKNCRSKNSRTMKIIAMVGTKPKIRSFHWRFGKLRSTFCHKNLDLENVPFSCSVRIILLSLELTFKLLS